jgi:hypothetical protein
LLLIHTININNKSSDFVFSDNLQTLANHRDYLYDIFEAIKCIHSNACGVDNIPIRFINLLLPVVMPFIVYIINTCITKSRISSKWKISKVFPCPKIPKPSNISDFRPISILPSISKVFEIIFKDQIVNYLNSSNLLTDFQSGFRKHFSTISALLNITDDITSNIVDGKVTLMTLLDFSKAFDSMSHSILLNKLHDQFHLSNSSLKLILCYLSGRTQKVVIGDRESDYVNVKSGVP